MIDHDRLFKEIVTTFFGDFLALFLPEVVSYVEPDSFEFLDKEVFTDVTSGEKYEADIVVRVRFRGQEAFFIIHQENQSYDQTGFARRMFAYFARFDAKYSLPVYPIALFTYDTPLREEPNTYTVAFPDFTPLTFQFRAIQLNRLDWRKFVDNPNPIAAALMAKMKIAPEDRPKVKAQCLRLLATLRLNPAKMQLIWGFVESYLKLNRDEQQVFKQEIAAIESEEIKEEAIEMLTIEEWGILKGKQSATLNMVERHLTRLLGLLDSETQARLEDMTTEQLEALDDAAFDFKTREELNSWLAQHNTPNEGN